MKFLSRSTIHLFVRYGLAILILIYFFRTQPMSWPQFERLVTPSLLIKLIGLKLLVIIVISLRWVMILRALSVSIRFDQGIGFSLLSIFFSYLLPGNMSADLVKSTLAARSLGSGGRVVLAVVVDRIVGLLSLLIILIAGLIFYSLSDPKKHLLLSTLLKNISWGTSVFILFLITLIMIGLYFYLSKKAIFERVRDVLFELNSWFFWLKTISLSLVSHFIFILFLAFSADAIGLKEIDLTACMLIFPLSTLLMIVPLTPGSLGVGQLVYDYLFSLYTGHPTQASLIFTVSQAIDVIFVIAGAWYLGFLLKKKNV